MRANSGSSNLLPQKHWLLKKCGKTKFCTTGKFYWVSGFLGKIENASAVLDTPGGLCPTGGGKPGGLGCGSLKVTV